MDGSSLIVRIKDARSAHREIVLQRALAKFNSDPEACRARERYVLGDLIYGWANEGYSASEDYLSACIRHALTSTGSVLECGSGLTTMVVGDSESYSQNRLVAGTH